MKNTIKVYDLSHAVECVFYDNLVVDFEDNFGEWLEDEVFEDYLNRLGIVLEDIVDFLNGYSEDNYEVA